MAAVPHQQCTIKVIHDGQGGSYALHGETGEQMHLPEVWKLLFSDNGHAYIKSEGKPARWMTTVLKHKALDRHLWQAVCCLDWRPSGLGGQSQ
jgi:hypothetical protein